MGLQKKFYFLASVELAWRGGEGVPCLVGHFKPEIYTDGRESGRIEYNPVFTKTYQGGKQKTMVDYFARSVCIAIDVSQKIGFVPMLSGLIYSKTIKLLQFIFS